MAGIYDLMRGIQQQSDQGTQRGLAQLVGKAYGAPQEQRQQILGTVAQRGGADMAFNAEKHFGSMDENARKRLGQQAAALLALPEDMRAQAYPQFAQEAQRIGIPAPPSWTPNYAKGLNTLATAFGVKDSDGTPAQQQYAEWLLSQVPKDQRDQTLGVLAGYKPRPSGAAIQYKEVMGEDGVTRWVAMDPREVGSQVIGGGQSYGSGVGNPPGQPAPSGPTSADMQGDIQLANDMIAAGIPADRVDAFIASRGQRTGAPMSAANGQDTAPQSGDGLPSRPDYQNGGLVNPFQSRPQEQQKYLDARAAQQAQIDTLPTINTLEAQGAGEKKTAELGAQRESDRIDNAPKAASALSAAKMAGESVNRAIVQAIPNINVWTTGLIGQPLSKLNTPQAANLRASLDTIEANIAFDRLQQMRMSSPTGGALGSISERELTLLGSTITSLKQSQSPDQLRGNLQFLQKQYAKVLKQLEADFKRDFGSARPSPAGGNNVIRYDAQGNRLP